MGSVLDLCIGCHAARPNSQRLLNNPITVSGIKTDLETQLILHVNRLIRVLNVKCFRSIR